MKKRSLFIVVAMVLLLAVVLGMGGTTFAKYITKDFDDTNTATVAKWGYVVNIDAENLFSDAYKNDLAVANTENGLEVDAAAYAVAPGTKGSFTISVDGTAEVLSAITFDMTVASDVVLAEADGQTRTDNTAFTTPLVDDYYPIVWTVTDVNNSDAELFRGTLDALDAWFATQTTANANNAPNTPVNIDWKITWNWAFENQNDDADTKLGDLVPTVTADDYTGNTKVVVDFDLTVTVQQLDKVA